jgi:hypothetical protein
MQLARRCRPLRTMRATVDHQRTRATNSFATIVIKNNCLFAFEDQALVQLIEHLEKRCFVTDFVDRKRLEVTFGLGAGLTPNL